MQLRVSRQYTAMYAGVHAVYWMAVCAGSGFVSVYLLQCGYKNAEIGQVLALANLLSAVLQPSVANLCDRQKRLRIQNVIMALSALLIALLICMALLPQRPPVLSVLTVVITALISLLLPMVNVLGTQYEMQGIFVDYGLARAAGSLFYAGLVTLLGREIAARGVRFLPYVSAAFFLGLIAVTACYRAPGPNTRRCRVEFPLETGVSQAAARPLSAFVRENPAYMVFVLAITLVFSGQSMYGSFSIQILENIGGGAAELGVSLLIAALSEIPTMFASGRLRGQFGCRKLLQVSACFFMAKPLILWFANSVPVYYLAQLMQIGGYALFIPTSVMFAAEAVSPADAAKAQAFVTTGCTLGAIVASILGGWLLDAYGVKPMLSVCLVVAAAGSLLMVIAARLPARNGEKE